MSPAQFRAFLSSLSPSVYPILGPDYSDQDFCSLDLSIHNPSLEAVNVASVHELGQFVDTIIANNTAKVAYGGYLEQRGIYQRSAYFNQSDPKTERSIHLGLDLWIAAETPIHAPLSGTLHSFNNNTNFGDYGPTLILEHNIKNATFYTLYGHLSLKSLDGKQVGQAIHRGELIATLGAPEVNGNYPPHLHFQMIRDLQGNFGDYPGVSALNNLEFYKENCPDPNLLLNLY